VISIEDQDALYRLSPHNVIRLILGRQYDGDGPDDNRYTRASKTLSDWVTDGVLTEDDAACFYIYEQQFEVQSGSLIKRYTRRGVLAALKLEPFGEGAVFPHEETFSSHKADRLMLIRACRANLSPIFGLLPDADGGICKLLAERVASTRPTEEVTETSGVINRMWAVSDPDFCAQLTAACALEKVFIADGHHRYETACTYSRERHANDSRPGAPLPRGYDFALMMCVPMSDPGLHILPTHRMVTAPNSFHAADFLGRVSKLFDTQSASDSELTALAEEEGGVPRYGLVLADGEKRILTAKPIVERAMEEVAGKHSSDWRSLDVAVLHELILKKILGLGDANSEHKHNVTYTKDAHEVLTTLSGKSAFHLGILMRPTRIDQVVSVSEHGEKMPQKSTYFYPKLLSGLVIRKV